MEEKLKKYIDYKKSGIYIELGAFDGVFQSNTKWLEDKYGWTGILIEPSPNKYKECLNKRKNNIIHNCACVSFDYTNKSIKGDFIGTPMCSVSGKRKNRSPTQEVNAFTLQKLIDDSKYKEIDFLSLDVEGYELEVLKGINFSSQKIKFFLIEIYNKDKDIIFDFMDKNNYILMENITNFKKSTHPNWDGTHNDYLFKLKI
jgi:FkbM family methyltransferase